MLNSYHFSFNIPWLVGALGEIIKEYGDFNFWQTRAISDLLNLADLVNLHPFSEMGNTRLSS